MIEFASTHEAPKPAVPAAHPAATHAAGPFAAVTTLFFAWGFITSMIDPLVTAVRGIFSLSYTEALLTQFAFFMAYGVVSLPAAWLAGRLNYSRAALLSLATMLCGTLIVLPAVRLDAYPLILVALFVAASGITLLQVLANPLAAALGAPERSHFRLNLAQGFNSLGTVLGPILAAQILLQGGVFDQAAGAGAGGRAQSLGQIMLAYGVVAVLLGLLILFIARVGRRFDDLAPPLERSEIGSAFAARWACFGAAALFLYVGAEVSIGSILISYLHQDDVLGLPFVTAGRLVSLYWAGAMAGRFIGSALLLGRLPAARVLGIAASLAAILCLANLVVAGLAAGVAALSIGLFNSIMFPTIFTLTLERSSAGRAGTSGLLCMAIIGGALLPLAVGHVADLAGLHWAFAVPAAAYLGIVIFAAAAAAVPPLERKTAETAA